LFFKDNLQDVKETLLPELTQRLVFIISNTTVHGLYAKQMEKLLEGSSFHWILIQDGEKYKNWNSFQSVVEQVDALSVTRTSLIIGFGGGVVGDLAGFVASTILRGIDYIAIPTTLLAMVDSSIGGKTAINTREGKNRLGSFYPPKMVLMPFECLLSLPQKEIQCGLGEIIKHGILGDERILEILEEDAPKIAQKDLEILIELVQRSCSVKGEIVMEDENERGRRKILNLGHTIGHAIEKVLNYDGITHGHAVAIGIVTELKWMVSEKFLDSSVVERIQKILKRLDMSTKIRDISKEDCIRAISFDKKRKYDMITMSIVEDITVVNNMDIPMADISKIVEHLFLGEKE
jgi:3-dehydroquinate synthase